MGFVQNKLPLILFSGGMDSTFMLYQALQKSDVDVIYIEQGQYPHKVEAEKQSCAAIIEEIERSTTHPSGYKVRNKFSHFLRAGILGRGKWSFSQPSAWLFGSLEYIDHNIHSELQIGYVMGDQISSQLDNIESAWNSLQAFSKPGSVPLSFPLKYVSKQMILQNLPQKLMTKVWICETPEGKDLPYKHCGYCVPCKTMFSLLAMRSYDGTPYASSVKVEPEEFSTDAYKLFKNYSHRLTTSESVFPKEPE